MTTSSTSREARAFAEWSLRYLPSMKTIEVRNVPDRTHSELSARAAAAGLSLSDYALATLERSVRRTDVADLLRSVRSRPGGVSAGAIVDAVRSGRDSH